jgi:hypothetical protein
MLPPATAWAFSKSTTKRTFVITLVLVEISTQTLVNTQSQATNTHNFTRKGKVVRPLFQKGRMYRLNLLWFKAFDVP